MEHLNIYIYRNGRQYGPYSEESVWKFLKEGKASIYDWAWTKGLNDWTRLSDLLNIMPTEVFEPDWEKLLEPKHIIILKGIKLRDERMESLLNEEGDSWIEVCDVESFDFQDTSSRIILKEILRSDETAELLYEQK